jgi:hypothetical protein
MQFDSMFQQVPGFTLVSPGYRPAGRLVLTVGANLVAELDQCDLLESWAAAAQLSPEEASGMTEAAAEHLLELLADGLPAVDIADAVTDAAVVFLLAMKRHGISDPERIPACSVLWSGRREQVVLSA